jgi:signal transduction histidine kinase
VAGGLRPVEVDAEGLMTALAGLADSAQALFKVDCAYVCEEPIFVPDQEMATQLYRIAQEAVTNAAKHGAAAAVVIRLTRGPDGEGFTLAVEDDGRGIPEPLGDTHGMGIKIMRYRARLIGASLELRRAAPHGTVVLCTVGAARPEQRGSGG